MWTQDEIPGQVLVERNTIEICRRESSTGAYLKANNESTTQHTLSTVSRTLDALTHVTLPTSPGRDEMELVMACLHFPESKPLWAETKSDQRRLVIMFLPVCFVLLS